MGVFLQRIIAVFRRCAVGLAALADIVDRRVQVLCRHAGLSEDFGRIGALRERQRQQQRFSRNIAVSCLFRDLSGLVEEKRRIGGQIDLTGPGPFGPGQLVQRHLGRGQGPRRIAASGQDQTGGATFLVIEQNFQNMQRRQLLMIAA